MENQCTIFILIQVTKSVTKMKFHGYYKVLCKSSSQLQNSCKSVVGLDPNVGLDHVIATIQLRNIGSKDGGMGERAKAIGLGLGLGLEWDGSKQL